MTKADNDAEHRLAVLTSWALFGAFGIAIVASGFRQDQFLLSSAGYAVLIAGFIAHIIINRIYLSDFRVGEIATAITLFGVATLAFMGNWALAPDFSEADVESGLLGLVLVVVCFIVFIAIRHGFRGAFSMFHIHRD